MYKLLFISLILFSSCFNGGTESKIIANWNFSESDANNCDECNDNSKNCCVFNYKGKRYLRAESYILDEFNKIDSIYSYHVPLGVNVYSVEERISLMAIDTIGVKELLGMEIKYEKGIITDGSNIYNDFYFDKTMNSFVVEKNKELHIYQCK